MDEWTDTMWTKTNILEKGRPTSLALSKGYL